MSSLTVFGTIEYFGAIEYFGTTDPIKRSLCLQATRIREIA